MRRWTPIDPLMFEGYALELANERLLHEGEGVPLAPKAFAVLRRLVEDGGQVVTKKELLRVGWASTHVTDGVLKVRFWASAFTTKQEASLLNSRDG